MTAPGEQGTYTLSGTVRNDATLGLVVDWADPSGRSGTVQLSQLPLPTNVVPVALQRDTVITSTAGLPEPPVGTVLKRPTGPAVVERTVNGWLIANAQGVTPTAWSNLTGQWKLIYIGTGV